MLEINNKKVIIIGAGPAGLTAAYKLGQAGVKSTVLEKDSIVGGISRTVDYKGYRFDIGGHRFYTKVKAVDDLWHEVLHKDFLRRSRLSRIYYNKKFYYYPLRCMNAFFNLGFSKSAIILLSYMYAQLFPEKSEDTFDLWVSNRFGKRLYETFFKSYTEKVWGMPCNEISSEWAAQRIKGLSLTTLLKDALSRKNGNNKDAKVKTLINAFHYPTKGPGMMWEAFKENIQQMGGEVNLGVEVDRINRSNGKIVSVEVRNNGKKEIVGGTDFVSTMPIRELVQKITPPVPEKVRRAALDLKYRDFLSVALIVDQPDVFPDNWIYIHEPEVKVGRIQNYKNWSPHMVPDSSKTCLGLEYFCFQGDELWTKPDHELIELGKKELEILGLVSSSNVVDGSVVRMPKAYPVYDATYRASLQTIREYLDSIKNLQLIGRNGMHKYNNQDHSMLTAMLAVENILGARHEYWKVNEDQEYHEEVSTAPSLPPAQEKDLIRTFARTDKLAFATATGTVSGLLIFIATIWLVIKGGDVIGPNLQLLGEYFPGYSVTLRGALIGFGYSFFWGFLFGWLSAYLRNLSIAFYLYRVKRKAELLSLRDFIVHF